jgi:hypothetical protein
VESAIWSRASHLPDWTAKMRGNTIRGSILDGLGCYSHPAMAAEKSIRYGVQGGNGSTFARKRWKLPPPLFLPSLEPLLRPSSLEPRSCTSELLLRPPSFEPPPRRVSPARPRCLIRPARPCHLGEGLDAAPPGPPSLTA